MIRVTTSWPLKLTLDINGSMIFVPQSHFMENIRKIYIWVPKLRNNLLIRKLKYIYKSSLYYECRTPDKTQL